MPIAVSRGQALRGVRPVIDGGTGGADAATARTNLSVHTEAEHAVFHDDDSLILGGRFTVLNTADIDALSDAAGQAAVQTALNNFDTVFIRRTGSGNINWGTTNFVITIPDHKSLIGIGRGSTDDQFNYSPYFNLQGTSQRFFLQSGAVFKNFGFDLQNPGSSNSNALIEPTGGTGMRLVSRIRCDYGNSSNRNHPLVGGTTTHVRVEYCTVWAVSSTITNGPIINGAGSSSAQGHFEGGVYYCNVQMQSTTKSANAHGIRCYYGNVIGCSVYRAGGHGIYFLPAQGSSPTRIVDNIVWDCNGSGFFQGTSVSDNGWFTFHGNKAHLSGDHGVYLPYNRTSIHHGIAHDNYSVLSNQNASGSANYLFGNAHINTQNF